jgi:amidase
MVDVPFRSAKQLAADIKRKKIGCLELLDLYLARVEKYDGALNAVVVRDFDRARTRARAADRALARRQLWGPLHGVPMTIKESYDVVGLPTTWGVPAYKDRIATKNAVVVDRLLRAGVVLFGKTNVPLYLGDWQSFNAIYGTTNNPWDVTRAPGGSSGGSAAALAAGLTGLEAGSDIGSSIRNPAHFCGVFGHKPTWGIVPRAGQALPWQTAPVDIDVVGPLARSADDLAIALAAMAGPDEIDGAGWQLRLAPARQKRLRDFKVALMLDAAPEIPVDREVTDRLQALADFLGRQKVKVDDRARPAIDTREAFSVYVKLLRAATSDRQSDAARGDRLAPRLARRQRGALPHAPGLGGVLHEVRPAPLPRRRQRGLPARPGGRASRPHARGQRQARAGHRSPLLGRLHRRVVPAVECRTLRVHAEPAPGGCADRRPTIRRSHVPGLRAPARARVPALRAATRLRVSGKHRAAPPG